MDCNPLVPARHGVLPGDRYCRAGCGMTTHAVTGCLNDGATKIVAIKGRIEVWGAFRSIMILQANMLNRLACLLHIAYINTSESHSAMMGRMPVVWYVCKRQNTVIRERWQNTKWIQLAFFYCLSNDALCYLQDQLVCFIQFILTIVAYVMSVSTLWFRHVSPSIVG